MIVNVPKAQMAIALQALWQNSTPAFFFVMSGRTPPPEPSLSMFQDLVASERYIDYFGGRLLKVSIESNGIDTTLYDRDMGAGRGEYVILERLTRPDNG